MAKQRLYAVELELQPYRGVGHFSRHIVAAPSKIHAERAIRTRQSTARILAIRSIPIPSAFDNRAAIAFARRVAEGIGSFMTR